MESQTLTEKLVYFQDWQKRIIDLDSELKKQMALYKAEMKVAFGLADGDQTNVLDLVTVISKIVGMSR